MMATAALAVVVAGCGATAASLSGRDSGINPGGHALSTSSTTAATHASLSAGTLAHRLGLTGVLVYNAATDPNHLLGRQNGYSSKASWGGYATAADDGTGGSIEVFPTTAGAALRANVLEGLVSPYGDGYDFPVGTAILRLGSAYTPAQAYALGVKFAGIVRAE